MAANLHTHYDTLQISRTASDEVVRGAYRFLCQKWHPDKHSGDRAEAEGVMRELNEAYRILSNPELRSRYDEWLVSSDVESNRNGSSAEHGAEAEGPEDPMPQRRTVWWRAWYIVLTAAAAACLVLVAIVTFGVAASRSGFVSVGSQIIGGLVQVYGFGAVCIYGYSMLFPPGRDSPEWFADVSGELQDATWKEWMGSALGCLLLSSVFFVSADHFDHSIKTSAPVVASGQVLAAPTGASSSAAAPAPTVQQAAEGSSVGTHASGNGVGKTGDDHASVNAQIAAVHAELASIQGESAKLRQQRAALESAQRGVQAERDKVEADQEKTVAKLVAIGNEAAAAGLDAQAAEDYRVAADAYLKLAGEGSASAQFGLGKMYLLGQGVPQNDATAALWFQKAAAQGEARAQANLGEMYAQGRGVSQDCPKAAMWLQKAAVKGFALAQHNLGNLYLNGQCVEQSDTEAFEWFQKAAGQGYPSAQNNLGYMYRNGKGVPRDDVKAVEWVQMAAQQGDAYGQLNLGRIYALGLGVSQDLVQADQWFLLAQAVGLKEAEAAVSDIEKQMTPDQIAEARRRAQAWQPSRGSGQQEPDPSPQTPQASAQPESAENI